MNTLTDLGQPLTVWGFIDSNCLGGLGFRVVVLCKFYVNRGDGSSSLKSQHPVTLAPGAGAKGG